MKTKLFSITYDFISVVLFVSIGILSILIIFSYFFLGLLLMVLSLVIFALSYNYQQLLVGIIEKIYEAGKE